MKSDAVIIQQIYQDGGFINAINLTMPRLLSYAKRWEIDFDFHYGNIMDQWDLKFGGWAKLPLILSALERGYKYVIWLDADTVIADINIDLRDGCPEDGIGMVKHHGPPEHFNVGVMYFTNTLRVRQFLAYWILWYPGPADWREQAVLNLLCKIPELNVVRMIDNKWNSTRLAGCHVDNAIVEGFHGEGTADERAELMRLFMENRNV